MNDITAMLQKRQGSESPRLFASKLGLPRTTYLSYIYNNRRIGMKGLRKMIKYFKDANDVEMVDALIKYSTGD